MAISLKPQHLNRYRQIAWLFIKYGRSDLVKETGLEETLAAEERITPKEAAKADELAGDLEKLGPTFVKLGQLLSTRVELLPRAYLEALGGFARPGPQGPFARRPTGGGESAAARDPRRHAGGSRCPRGDRGVSR